MNSGWRYLPTCLVKSNRHNCILLTLIPLAGLIGPGIAHFWPCPCRSIEGGCAAGAGQESPFLRVGRGSRSLQLGGGSFLCPTVVPPREEAWGLPGAAGQAELSQGGKQAEAILWTQNQASLSSQQEGPRRSLQGQLSSLPGVPTTYATVPRVLCQAL